MHYCVFNTGEKKQVLCLIKGYIMETFSICQINQGLTTAQWVKLFESLGPASFLLFLKRYIPLFVKFKKIFKF